MRIRTPLLCSLLLPVLVLSGCGEGVVPPPAGIDFGEIYIAQDPIEGSVALLSDGRASTLQSVAFAGGAAFVMSTALPLAMDAGAPYRVVFGFQPPADGYQVWDDTATITVASGSTTSTVAIPLHGIFTNGDLDGDGHVDADIGCEGCDDCDDNDAAVFPGNEEICDGKDNNCDGTQGGLEVDADGDNFLICEGDCNDNDVAMNPSVNEICDGKDNDCSGELSPDELDGDSDGVTGCAGDCEPTLPSVRPGATEICDGYDTDCSNAGAIPPDELDADGDNYRICEDDCDDTNALANPGRPSEVCDGFDTDCDGALLEGESDVDGDGSFVCNGDCDDGDPLRFPGNPEVCDFIDNDCDGVVPANEVDGDGDLSPSCLDCDDANAAVYPGAPDVCDSILDNDCSGGTDAQEGDGDADSFTECAGDCDDSDGAINPNATELCDGIDNDCSGQPLASELLDSDNDGTLDCTDPDCPIWVRGSYVGGASVGTAADPFVTIAAGIAAAEAGTCPTVAVLPGTYTEQVDFGTDELRLVAEEGPAVTTIDGGGVGPVVVVDGSQTATGSLLWGFTISGGVSVLTNGYSGHGGGVYVAGASLTVQANVISGNEARFHGGGLYSDGGDMVLLDNVFAGNTADFDGGAAYIKGSDGLIEANQILGNDAGDDAGGLFLGDGSLAEVRWNVIAENVCTGVNDAGGAGWGGGLLNHSGADTDVHNNLIVGNTAEQGGAVFVYDSAPTMTNNTIYDNRATAVGEPGGLRIFQGTFLGNIVAGGVGVGVRVVGSGVGVSWQYNDVWNHTAGLYYDDQTVAGNGDLTGLNGNLSVSPQFVAATANANVGDDVLSLLSTSLLINAGSPAPAQNDANGTRNDMGAYGGPDGSWP